MDLILVYAQPLPYLGVPLRSGVVESTSPVTLQRLSNGEVLAQGRAEQRLSVTRAPSQVGAEVIEIRTERRLQLADKTMVVRTGTWLKPGVGALLSEGTSPDGPITRQELICATIAGRQVGTCGPGGGSVTDPKISPRRHEDTE